MKQENENRLPPIIVDYINKLRTESTNRHTKDVYCQILERVRDSCDKAIREYNGKLKTARR